MKKILVAGGGGFIGGYLVADLLRQGHTVKAVDIKPLEQWWQRFPKAHNFQLDLRLIKDCEQAVDSVDEVYDLACSMGGMGFIESHKAECMLSVLINTHLLMMAVRHKVKRFFFASSACVYNADKQKSEDVIPLKEEDAYPAMAEDGYGWQKLFGERMCRHFREDFDLCTRVARFHAVYGENGSWTGGREKFPAACCRKVAEAKLSGNYEIEVWGDGKQKRSFMYIEDCIKGMQDIMHSGYEWPLNLGTSQLVTVDEVVSIVEDIAGVKLKRRYNLSAPKGVNGRNSDNTKIKSLLGWEPSISLREGLEKLYPWVEKQVCQAGAIV